MKNKYKDMTLQERTGVLKEYAEKSLPQKMLKALSKKAMGKKLVIDFTKKLSPKDRASLSDKKASIIVGDDEIKLPPYKNEHYLCRAMFSKDVSVGEGIDWSIIFERMTGGNLEDNGKPLPSRKNWRTVYDALVSVNKRFQEKYNEDLFVWQENTIRRLR